MQPDDEDMLMRAMAMIDRDECLMARVLQMTAHHLTTRFSAVERPQLAARAAELHAVAIMLRVRANQREVEDRGRYFCLACGTKNSELPKPDCAWWQCHTPRMLCDEFGLRYPQHPLHPALEAEGLRELLFGLPWFVDVLADGDGLAVVRRDEPLKPLHTFRTMPVRYISPREADDIRRRKNAPPEGTP